MNCSCVTEIKLVTKWNGIHFRNFLIHLLEYVVQYVVLKISRWYSFLALRKYVISDLWHIFHSLYNAKENAFGAKDYITRKMCSEKLCGMFRAVSMDTTYMHKRIGRNFWITRVEIRTWGPYCRDKIWPPMRKRSSLQDKIEYASVKRSKFTINLNIIGWTPIHSCACANV